MKRLMNQPSQCFGRLSTTILTYGSAYLPVKYFTYPIFFVETDLSEKDLCVFEININIKYLIVVI